MKNKKLFMPLQLQFFAGTTMTDKDDVKLGSGDLYIVEFTGEVPEDTTIEVETNKIGHISGGASLEYTNEWKVVSDDMGVVIKNFLTKENVNFKSGILAWNGKVLKTLCATARVTEPDHENPYRIVKIGGKKHADGKSYIIHFVHTTDKNKKVKLTIVGTSRNGFTISFDPENETVIDAEFTAISQDADGTLVIYKEEKGTVG